MSKTLKDSLMSKLKTQMKSRQDDQELLRGVAMALPAFLSFSFSQSHGFQDP